MVTKMMKPQGWPGGEDVSLESVLLSGFQIRILLGANESCVE